METSRGLGPVGGWIIVPQVVRALADLYNWTAAALPYLNRFLLLDRSFLTILVPLLSLAFAALIRTFFVEFLGDVAIYTNLNQRSANFATRAQILDECSHALTSLYIDVREEAFKAGQDFKIVIAAHSLGTVIAYDTLNDLFNRARIGADPVGGKDAPSDPVRSMEICLHLGGMLTFGCPLNKIYYFFRDQSAAEELVRAQIIDGMHSFRLTCPAGKLRGAPVEPVKDANVAGLIEAFKWINVWSTMDVVSGKLFFYYANEQVHRHYWQLFPWSHLRYWSDQKMYEVFAEQLLGIPPRKPAAVRTREDDAVTAGA